MVHIKIKRNLKIMKLLNRFLAPIIFFVFSCSFSASAQEIPMTGSTGAITDFLLEAMDKTNTNWVLDGKREDIDGSPYLKDDFELGEIELIDNSVFTDILLRYNIYNDEIEYQDGGKNYSISAKHTLNKITIRDDIFVVEIYESSVGEKQGYFTLLANGEVKLLRKYNMELTDKVPARALQDPEPRKFIRKKDIYYVKEGLKRIHEFSNVKKLIEHLGDHQDELKTFTKKEKISSNNPEELAELINYYNSL